MRKNEKYTVAFLLAVAILVSCVPVAIVPKTQAATSVSDPAFSIIQISDTQFLAASYPQLFNDTAKWIVNNYAEYNTKMVIHTGDIVDNINGSSGTYSDPTQWNTANSAMSMLLNAGIPYCWDAGNHDQIPWNDANGNWLGSSYTSFNATNMRSKSYWVSDFLDSKNTAVRFSYNGYDFLIINLEYMANNATLDWMKTLLDNNKNANVIVAAHTYLNKGGGYGFSSAGLPGEVAWCTNLKAILNGYPKVFLTLSGHDPTGTANMTKVGNCEEVFFNRQGASSQTGAAAVRIYTFNLTSKQVNVSTYAYNLTAKNWGWLTDAYNRFSFDVTISSNDWILVNNARPLKMYPDLLEYIWQKNATMTPDGQYDKIGLHRLVKTGTTPKGVIFYAGCPMWGMGEQRISNPSTDNWTKTENFSSPIYWANRGYDVYAIDYRTNFVPKTLNASQLSFAGNWGWDMWVSDTKEATDKVKEVSGNKKFFIAGECSGGETALNYAAKYWKDDLRGIILLDGNFPGVNGYPIVGKTAETNKFNLNAAVANMNSAVSWAYESYRALRPVAAYALQNPGAPAAFPPGTPLSPPINPLTNKTWANITEWFTYGVQYNFGSTTSPAGSLSNLLGGNGDISQVENCFANNQFLPYRLILENLAMADWANCPYLNYDYNDHYNEIGVPVLAFAGPYTNQTGNLRFVAGIDNADFTANYMPKYGHLDFFFGTNSARDISQPALNWMTSHYQPPAASTFSSVTVMTGQTWYFCVHSNGGVGPHTYQWYEGTSPIAGQTTMVLAASKSAAGTYTYYCKVTDADGATTNSSPVTLTVK